MLIAKFRNGQQIPDQNYQQFANFMIELDNAKLELQPLES